MFVTLTVMFLSWVASILNVPQCVNKECCDFTTGLVRTQTWHQIYIKVFKILTKCTKKPFVLLGLFSISLKILNLNGW